MSGINNDREYILKTFWRDRVILSKNNKDFGFKQETVPV
jgi:hypothetical protein